ncbi:MAG: DUF3786 domain-containing protein [Eubacteriaceae bacterium]|nr:DUF3786 domain-containing protein [Eubacteriaceae bacterium]
MSEKEDRQYREMLAAAAKRMAQVDVPRQCAYAGVAYDSERNEITVESFGTVSVIKLPECTCDPPLHIWQHLSIFQYLEAAAPAASQQSWGSLADLPEGGHVRGLSFDREVDRMVSARLGKHSAEVIAEAAGRLGGEMRKDPKADLSAVFHFMPNYPFAFNMWFADDEFPASGKVLVDRSVCMFLNTEANGTLASLLVEMLCDAADALENGEEL